jgi:Arc/MetJ family transcription regulator
MSFMSRRTTVDVDEELLVRVQEALGETTPRAAVEEALRRVAEDSRVRALRADEQRRYLERLAERVDMSVLASEEMWR